MTQQLWLWSAGRRCGVSDDKERARESAEKAAIDGSCPALLELVVVGLDRNLEPVYVHTVVAYKGMASDNRVSWQRWADDQPGPSEVSQLRNFPVVAERSVDAGCPTGSPNRAM